MILRTTVVCGLLLASGVFRRGGAQAPVNAPRDLVGISRLVDSVMQLGMASEHIPGAAVLVLDRGKIVLERGYGLADLVPKRRVDPRTTLWPFASITKVFTATAVVQLAARGRVDLAADANRYLRSVRIAGAKWPPITVANLLDHTDALDELPGRQAASREKVLPLDRFLRARLVRIGAPGIVTRYGSYGVALAGVLIQDVSGLPYEQYLARNLFAPLGMQHSSIGPPATGEDALATPYAIKDGRLETISPEWYHTTPTSSLVSTVDDMARFMALHLETPVSEDTDAVLPRRWIREMARQQATVHTTIPGWGYGWQQNDANGQRIIEHGGDIGGFSSLLTLLPDERFGLLVVSHFEGNGLRFKLKQAILDRYFPDKRAPRYGVSRPQKELLAYAGTYLANNYCRTCADGERNAERFEIVANDDGSLGLWGDKWSEVAPLLFSSEDGKRRIGFMRDSSGKVMAVSAGSWRVLELLPGTAFGQTDIVKSEGITSPLHQANLGRIAFVAKPNTVDSLNETDFLKAFELKETGDLAIRAFMGNSLTNYLHRLAPQFSVAELTRNGNYQFSFFVDGSLIHKEQFQPAWLGPAENKSTKTVFAANLLNSANPELRWGAIWHVFLLNGGAQALTEGKHLLRLEMRPYLRSPELIVGDLIAAGELQLTVIKPTVDQKLTAIQPIQAGSGWEISRAAYDRESIRELKRQIAERLYKEITSVVVISNGQLLIEEYFNGANRNTLHDTRSVGKSFASTMMGIAIKDGYVKADNQTLRDFYDLRKFANYSTKKESVTIKSLLTMSSGFDANDDDQSSPGNEEKMYPTADWVKFALDLAMDDKTGVGEKWRYFTAGVIVLGDIIDKSVPGGLERYADRKLFQPLGITKYQWQYTPQKVPNTAGGLKMSALDFAKYGQLYQNGGKWDGKQIISRTWVEKTFTRQVRRGAGDDEYYGYLFWNSSFNIKGKQHEVFFSTGNGGSKIFVFKDQPLVIVITATAYGKWYMHRQVFSMMERYILPAVINCRTSKSPAASARRCDSWSGSRRFAE